jgi:hypothetical protein
MLKFPIGWAKDAAEDRISPNIHTRIRWRRRLPVLFRMVGTLYCCALAEMEPNSWTVFIAVTAPSGSKYGFWLNA